MFLRRWLGGWLDFLRRAARYDGIGGLSVALLISLLALSAIGIFGYLIGALLYILAMHPLVLAVVLLVVIPIVGFSTWVYRTRDRVA